MALITDFLDNLNNALNNTRDGLSTPNEIRARQKSVDYLQVAKVVTVALGILLITAALADGLLGALVLAPILFTATHDLYFVMDNVQQIFKNYLTELHVKRSDENYRNHLVCKTIVLKHII